MLQRLLHRYSRGMLSAADSLTAASASVAEIEWLPLLVNFSLSTLGGAALGFFGSLIPDLAAPRRPSQLAGYLVLPHVGNWMIPQSGHFQTGWCFGSSTASSCTRH